MGRLVNRSDLAEIHGVSLPTISAWVKRGCPFEQRGAKGREWLFDTAEVARWREDQAVQSAIGDSAAVDLDEARRRKTIAEAKIAELELAKAQRQVVSIDDVAAVVSDEYASVRARLLEIPGRLAQPLSYEADPAEVERSLKEAVSEALEELVADAGGDDSDGDDIRGD